MDAFDDVRDCAASFLKYFPKDIFVEPLAPANHNPVETQGILARADKAMRMTGRADFSDGFGRLNELYFDQISSQESGSSNRINRILSILDRLEHDIQIATSDLPRAVAQAPVHGCLISLRSVLLP